VRYPLGLFLVKRIILLKIPCNRERDFVVEG